MSEIKEDGIGLSLEKSNWEKTWSCLPQNEVYIPEDVKNLSYSQDVGHPGEYPFTRGIYPSMYRKRLWTRREVSGHTSPLLSNERLRYLLDHGETGLNIIVDLPSAVGIDSDHPAFGITEVGLQGNPFTSLNDMATLMNGIDLETTSTTFSGMMVVIYAQYVALAENRGNDIAKLKGTIINDILHSHVACGNWEKTLNLDWGLKQCIDCAEFSLKNTPLWHPICIDSYDLRETGIDAIQEVAFAFSLAFSYIDECVKRGIEATEITSRLSFTISAHIDLFEEIAKMRAMRRIWARSMKERYGIEEPKGLKLKFHANTAGCATFREQSDNNIIRLTVMAMAAVLGGCQSMHVVGYDEPICLCTEKSHRLALRTQEILAYEAGISNVADPLGGSYYIENLTSKLEEEITELLKKIDDKGGGIEVIKSGWMRNEMDMAAWKYLKEIENGERIIVGKNAFQIDEPEQSEDEVHHVSTSAISEYLESLEKLRATRDQSRLRKTLDDLARKADDRKTNLIRPMIEASKANATMGEVVGVIRESYGYPYDPFDILKNPFK